MSVMMRAVEPAAVLPAGEGAPGLASAARPRAHAAKRGAAAASDGVATGLGSRLGPAGRCVAVVHATCLFLALAYPQALASWLDDFEPNPVVEAAQGCVGRLVGISQGLGLARLSGTVRDWGKGLTHKPE